MTFDPNNNNDTPTPDIPETFSDNSSTTSEEIPSPLPSIDSSADLEYILD